jgi:hypothetical protein
LDFLGFLASAKANRSLAEIEDGELLEIIQQHCAALRIRKPEALPPWGIVSQDTDAFGYSLNETWQPVSRLATSAL